MLRVEGGRIAQQVSRSNLLTDRSIVQSNLELRNVAGARNQGGIEKETKRIERKPMRCDVMRWRAKWDQD